MACMLTPYDRGIFSHILKESFNNFNFVKEDLLMNVFYRESNETLLTYFLI